MVRSLLNGVLPHYPNRLRAQLGMAPVRDIVTQVWLSPHLPPRARLADTLQVCGFLEAPDLGIDGTLPAPLAAFLDAGEAPVYMTFGSWMPQDTPGQTRALRLLTDAPRRAGWRAIIQGMTSCSDALNPSSDSTNTPRRSHAPTT